MQERDKYLYIYSTNPSSYGKRDHGRNARDIILDLKPETMLDAGCGKGRMVEWAKSEGIDCIGCDFASGYGVQADVLDMPFDDKSFDLVTAFDLLEHLKEDDLHKALSEMYRVAKKFWVISIGFGRSRFKNGEVNLSLHPITYKDPQWWIPHLSRYSIVEQKGSDYKKHPYYVCELK